jgi:hypothetical protein
MTNLPRTYQEIITSLEQENERLRGALEKIVQWSDEKYEDATYHDIELLARAALQTKGDT